MWPTVDTAIEWLHDQAEREFAACAEERTRSIAEVVRDLLSGPRLEPIRRADAHASRELDRALRRYHDQQTQSTPDSAVA